MRQWRRSQFAANGGLKMRKKRFYTEEFRRLAVARMKGCRNVSALAEELDLPRRSLYRWQMRFEGPGATATKYPLPSRPPFLTFATQPAAKAAAHATGPPPPLSIRALIPWESADRNQLSFKSRWTPRFEREVRDNFSGHKPFELQRRECFAVYPDYWDGIFY